MRARLPVAAIASGLLILSACSSTGSTPSDRSTVSSAAVSAGAGAAASASATPTRRVRVTAHVVGHLPQPVSRAVGVLAGTRVVVLGGLASGDVTTGRVVTIDPSTHRARLDGSLAEAVHDASGAFLAGHAVVFGGGSATEVADVQSWARGGSRVVGHLPQGRSDSAAVAVGGTAYVVGGFDGQVMTRTVLASVDGRAFRRVGRLRTGVRYPAVAALGSEIYVFGGQLATTEGTSSGPQSDLVQRMDVRTGRTSVVGRLPRTLGHAMAFRLGADLYLAGGRHDTVATSRIWRVDPATGHLTAVGRLPFAVSDAATVVVGHTALLIGGETSGPYAPQSTIVAVRVPR